MEKRIEQKSKGARRSATRAVRRQWTLKGAACFLIIYLRGDSFSAEKRPLLTTAWCYRTLFLEAKRFRLHNARFFGKLSSVDANGALPNKHFGATCFHATFTFLRELKNRARTSLPNLSNAARQQEQFQTSIQVRLSDSKSMMNTMTLDATGGCIYFALPYARTNVSKYSSFQLRRP